MERLTKKDEFGNGYHLLKSGRDARYDVFDKLGKLEDIEQELGIGLLELGNILKKDIYVIEPVNEYEWKISIGKVSNLMIEEGRIFAINVRFNEGYYWVIYLDELGDKWFLTKEEAEKKLEEMNEK